MERPSREEVRLCPWVEGRPTLGTPVTGRSWCRGTGGIRESFGVRTSPVPRRPRTSRGSSRAEVSTRLEAPEVSREDKKVLLRVLRSRSTSTLQESCGGSRSPGRDLFQDLRRSIATIFEVSVKVPGVHGRRNPQFRTPEPTRQDRGSGVDRSRLPVVTRGLRCTRG